LRRFKTILISCRQELTNSCQSFRHGLLLALGAGLRYLRRMSIQSYFPSSVYQASLRLSKASIQEQNRELLDEVFKIRDIDEKGQKWSKSHYPGGYTSYASMDRLHKFSTTFEILQKKIDVEVQKFARHLEMDLQGRKLVMTSLWANIMQTQVVHSMHIHPLSVISGTYYVQTPKNSSALKLEDPRLVAFMASAPRKATARAENQRFISLQPKAGEIILFESWMRHEVPPNQSSTERVSLSFNYDWI
jgi:uncharacterized protein (TIGR02466 family)